jgi:hypothetical protein
MEREDIWHDGEKEKEAKCYKGGKEGRGGDVRGGDFGSLRFAGID